MFIDELREYYGLIDDEAKVYIEDRIGKYKEQEQVKLKEEFIKKFPRNRFPDISSLSKFFDEHKPKVTFYFWAVCLECGCEYDYNLPMCPACYDKGFDCRTKAVKKSEFKPTFKVIKYNKHYMNGDKNEPICFTCMHKKESYCAHFGNPDWQCHREEYEMCECKLCCGKAKAENRKLADSMKDKKFSYAMPLKRSI